MKRIVIRPAVVVSILGALLLLANIAGTHPSQTGIMLIAPSYRIA